MLTPPPLLALLRTPESDLEWVSCDSSNERSGLAYWRGLVQPRLLRVCAVPRPLPADFRRTWWEAFGFIGRDRATTFVGMALEIHDGAEPWVRIPLAVHRGRIIERWHDVQGTERGIVHVNSSEWRRVARETLALGDRAPGTWSWPADRDAIKPLSLALANQHWRDALAEPLLEGQDDEAEAILVGHWVAATGALQVELGKMRRKLEDEAAKARRREESAARAEARRREDEARAARVAARKAKKAAASAA